MIHSVKHRGIGCRGCHGAQHTSHRRPFACSRQKSLRACRHEPQPRACRHEPQPRACWWEPQPRACRHEPLELRIISMDSLTRDNLAMSFAVSCCHSLSLAAIRCHLSEGLRTSLPGPSGSSVHSMTVCGSLQLLHLTWDSRRQLHYGHFPHTCSVSPSPRRQ